MTRKGWFDKAFTSFRGAWTALAQFKARPERAFAAQNVRFFSGKVRTRDGTSVAQAGGANLTSSGKVTSMFQWITSALNYLVYYDNGSAKMKDLASSTAAVTLYTEAGRGISAAEFADRMYLTTYTNAGLGGGQARFVNTTILATPVDKAFMGPVTTVPTVADNGAGNCSEGLHYFGYIVESRSGFAGKFSPVTSVGAEAFAPVSLAVAAGGRKLNMTFTLTVTAPPVIVRAVMTRVDNPYVYYFPLNTSGREATFTIDTAGAIPVTIADISESDEDLASSDRVADDHQNYLTQDRSGAGPFNPSWLVPVGKNRMLYVVDSKVYISDQYAPEVITEARHMIQMPGKRRIITAFPLRGMIFYCGPGWTYVSVDDGQDPRSWPRPEPVSELIGTTAVRGVCWQTAGDWAWIANEIGLWKFDGAYDDKPVSFLVEDQWKRINWAAPYAVQVVDHVKARRVEVQVPLDGATEPTHIFTFDYSNGLGYSEVDFSVDVFASYPHSSICIVQNPSTGTTERWLAPTTAGSLLRENGLLTTGDNTVAVDSYWQSGYLLAAGEARNGGKLNRFSEIDPYVKGSGTLLLTAYTMDESENTSIGSVTLASAPGKEQGPGQRFNLINENISVKFRTNGVGHWFDLSSFGLFWKKYGEHR